MWCLYAGSHKKKKKNKDGTHGGYSVLWCLQVPQKTITMKMLVVEDMAAVATIKKKKKRRKENRI